MRYSAATPQKRLESEAASAAAAAAERVSYVLGNIRAESLFLITNLSGYSEQSRSSVLSSLIQAKPEITEVIATDSRGYTWFTAGRTGTPPIGADYSAEESVSSPLKLRKHLHRHDKDRCIRRRTLHRDFSTPAEP
ncbi:MAG: hypothetical protein LRY51_10755 [Geovibrio sp.]|nr:hypothetical protein [Geovibrio sp.]